MDEGTAAATVIDVATEDRLKAVSDGAAPPTEKAKPAFVATTSRQFPNWLADSGGSLAVSTYQSGKVILIGTNRQTGRLSVFERTLERPMGMAFRDSRLAIASMIQITSFVDAAGGAPGTAGYDALLWASDINFVRGEDSFVRAQWAGRPFVWHIYPQQAGAHEAKLNAFLAAYCEVLPEDAAQAVRGLWTAWNNVTGAPPLAEAWCDFVDARLAQRQGLLAWQEQLLAVGDLTGNLLRFCHGLGDKK